MGEVMTVDIKGVAELEQALFELGNALAGKVLFGGLMDAALPIQKAAQAAAPVSTKVHYQYKKGQKIEIQPGNLRKSIKRKRLKVRDEQASAQVGIAWTGRAFYGRFIEFGLLNKQHVSLLKRIIHRIGYRAEFGSSNESAKPFLRPAFEEKKDDALRIFKDRLSERIEKQRQISAAKTAGVQ